jgi:hypothetical protein
MERETTTTFSVQCHSDGFGCFAEQEVPAAASREGS